MSLPIHGQGVILFRAYSTAEKVVVRLSTKDSTDGFLFEWTQEALLVNRIGSLEPLPNYPNPEKPSGLSKHKDAYYWISLDSQNQKILAGIGEPRAETGVYQHRWPLGAEDAGRETNKRFMESIVNFELEGVSTVMRIIKDPITSYVPVLVKDVSQLTMADIAAGSSAPLPSANLSPMAKKLYDCVAGEKFVLDTPDFPEFSQAIEHSLRTPGCWCYKRIQEKSTEFNKDKPNLDETYLRITLGENNGESPGIPYVMEIWPPGHYSPVHNHGGAEAVIRVLHGEIQVSLFPFLCSGPLGDGVPPFLMSKFKKGDITYITPTLNQVHQLKNTHATETCVTIQCYMYDAQNKRHYDYFDYLDDTGKKQQYEPDSDKDFLSFRDLMKKEWAEQKEKERVKKSGFCFWG